MAPVCTTSRPVVAAVAARPRRVRRARQGGFNFAEVLFAVMILALGFIMIAAIFPVALRQTQLNGEEVVAGTTARSGVNYLEQVGLNPGSLPVTVQTTQVAPAPVPLARTVPASTGPGTPNSISVPGVVYSFRDFRVLDPAGGDNMTPGAAAARLALWKQVNGNLILPSDNRMGWVAFYRRGATYVNNGGADAPHTDPGIVVGPHAFAQVYVFGVASRNRSIFEQVKDARRYPGDLDGNAHASLEPRRVSVKLREGHTQPDRITFHADFANNSALFEEPAAVEGAFVIISDDQFTHVNPGDPDPDPSTGTAANPNIETNGQSNGRIYRLGSRIGLGEWELALGWDMPYDIGADNGVGTADDVHQNIPPRAVAVPAPGPSTPAPGFPAVAYLVGRGWVDPTDPSLDVEGPSQVTGVYTTFIQAN